MDSEEIKVLYVGQSNDTGALVFTSSLAEANKRLVLPFTHYVHGDDHFQIVDKLQQQIADYEKALDKIKTLEAIIQKLEDGLRFYSKSHLYQCKDDDSLMTKDNGEYARIKLAEVQAMK